MTSRSPLVLPDGKRFAFTIFDDTDNATVANTRPFYELLASLGMRTTKSVWCFDSADAHPNWAGSATLADPDYRAYACELQARGFEIGFHGASMMSSLRARVQRALDLFHDTFGHYPRSYAHHASNQENLYWGPARFRLPLLRLLYARFGMRDAPHSSGHLAGSPYFWGDLCQQSIAYVRGFTFPVLDLFSVHRHILYRDPTMTFVNFWFSATHAPNVETFNALLRPSGPSALREGGVCIIATHLASGFVQNGAVHPETRRLLESLAQQNGWFVPVSTLLDYLRQQGFGQPISLSERWLMELRWGWYALRRGAGM